jgi:nucleotide-binding universal stress UspA family protein
MTSTFLVATDFSEASARARDYVIALAAPGDRIVVLHAHPLPLPDWPEPPYVPDWMPAGPSVRGAQFERLRAFAGPARAASLRVDTVLEEGLAADVILGRVAALQPDLVALGTGRRATMGNWIMGSTAERVVRRSPVPVLTVSAEAPRPQQRIRAVLCAVDFAGGDTLAAARRLAARCGSALTVMHVVEGTAGASRDERRRQAEQRLSEALRGADPGPAAQTLVREGKAAREIVSAAQEGAVDIVVIGLRDAGRWPTELPHVGSTAGPVMRQATCAVITVRGASGHRAASDRVRRAVAL